jgi:VanZ family protein
VKLTFLTFCFSLNILADSTRVNPYRLGAVIGATAGILTLAHIQQYNSWWKGELTKFHFKDDFNQVLNADKFGHAYFSFLISDLFGKSLEWAGVKKEKATLYGGIGSLLFQTYVEVEDGFRPSLGFSVSDEVSNFIGAFLPFFKEKFPTLKIVNFKMSAFPSEKFKSGAHRFIVDDYESLYFWLCFDVAEILKLKQLKFWAFDIFDLAIGYSVKEIDWRGNGKRELFLSLDYDLSKIPVRIWFLKQIFALLNYYHLPAPTLQLTPRLKFFIVKI